MKQTEPIAADAKAPAPKPGLFRGLFQARRPRTPATDAVAEERPAATDIPRIAPLAQAQPVDGHCPKVLVVDDDPVILKTIGVKLSKAGFEVVTGHDGAEAITTARKENPDVIVLDINFPPDVAVTWDGIGVMKWLQRMDSDNARPIIIITSLTQENIREKALAAGAAAFFQKPIDNEALITFINKTLDLRRAGEKTENSSEAKAADLAV